MKYLKTFEDTKLKYKEGDYVKIKIIPDYVLSIERIPENLFVKILNIKIKEYDDITYYIEFETLITKKLIHGNQYFIDRKMTKSEIKYCKLKSETNKFNL